MYICHSKVFYQAKPEFQHRFTAASIFPTQTDRLMRALHRRANALHRRALDVGPLERFALAELEAIEN